MRDDSIVKYRYIKISINVIDAKKFKFSFLIDRQLIEMMKRILTNPPQYIKIVFPTNM